MQRIIAQAHKELKQTFRDRITLLMALALPLTTFAILGISVSLTVKDLPIIVQDFDQSYLSRQFIDHFRQSLTFRVIYWPLNIHAERALEDCSVRAVIVIPENFERDMRRGRMPKLQMLVDATDANTANIIRGKAKAITQSFHSLFQPLSARPNIKVSTRLWFNPGLKDELYIGPGAFAVVLYLFPPLFAALAMSRESEEKTLFQVYISGISAAEFLLGKVFAYFIIAFIEWALLLLLALTLFGLRFAVEPTPLLLGTVFYLFCNVCCGIMIGVLIRNQAAAIQAVQIGGFVLSFLMSGFIFPLSNIPSGIRWISIFVPARYYIELTRDAFSRGAGWPAVWHAPLALAALGLFFFIISWRVMKPMKAQE
jgi:ABC-2 type transport system permease protein